MFTFNVLGLKIEVTRSSLLGTVGLLVVFTALAVSTLALPFWESFVWGVMATLIYWVSETLHQYGHARAARSTGYPMTGVRLWAILGESQYPADEPPLPASVHRRRALGGPVMSLTIGLVCSVLALLLRESWDVPELGLVVFAAAVNTFFFGVGAFVPLSFSDGGTLLRYWGQRD